jgi:hypothetical protein
MKRSYKAIPVATYPTLAQLAQEFTADAAERAIARAALGAEPSGECCTECGEFDCSNVFLAGPACEGFPEA